MELVYYYCLFVIVISESNIINPYGYIHKKFYSSYVTKYKTFLIVVDIRHPYGYIHKKFYNSYVTKYKTFLIVVDIRTSYGYIHKKIYNSYVTKYKTFLKIFYNYYKVQSLKS